MSTKVVLSVLSGLVFVYAFFPYVKAILRGEARPRKATWLVWATGDVIILAGMLSKHTVNGLMIAANVGAITVFLLALKFGEPGWNKRDKVCITLSVIAIALWIYFGESNIGIALSLVALAIAAWPTYVSAWENPANENRKAWIAFNLSNALAVAAVPSWIFVEAASPIVFCLIDLPMLYLLFVKPRGDAALPAEPEECGEDLEGCV